jgi:hypothetical protein
MKTNEMEEKTAIGHFAGEIETRLACGDILGAVEICEGIIAACNVSLGRAMIQMSRVRYMELLLKEKELFRRQMAELGRAAR